MKNIKLFSQHMYLAGIALSLSTVITATQPEPTITLAQVATSRSATESVTPTSIERSQATPIESSITTSSTSNIHTNINQQTDNNGDNNGTDVQATNPTQPAETESLKKRVRKQFTRFYNSAINHFWGTGSFKQHFIRRIATALCAATATVVYIMRTAPNRLIEAALHGDESTVKTLLHLRRLVSFSINTLSFNAADLNGLTALHAASKNGHTQIVTLLLQHHADPNTTNCAGRTALHEATRRYNAPETVQRLLQAQANVNAQDNPGFTALFYAAANNPATVKSLLDANANALIFCFPGYLPLHIAAQFQQCQTVNLLLEAAPHTIDMTTNNCGDTPLHLAADNIHNRPLDNVMATIGALLLKNANPNIRNRVRELPMHLSKNPEVTELLRAQMAPAQ